MTARLTYRPYPTGHLADTYAGAACTLDGAPAIIAGRANEFATVAALPNGPAYQYSWATVELVMTTAGGRFRS